MKDEIFEGIVEWFNAERGYGFIKWQKDGQDQKDMFVHFSGLEQEGFKNLFKDQLVTFSVGTNIRGEPVAVNVTIIS